MTYKNQISEKPKLPLISIYKKRGFEIINEDTMKYFTRTNAYNLIQNESDSELYSKNMEVWNFSQKTDKFKNTKWNRFLAKTIYNPIYDVTLVWKKIGIYKLEELKTKIKICIDKDDDVFTQFVEADFFKNMIDNSSSFNELINTLNKYYFEIKDEEMIWKEQDKWNENKNVLQQGL